jgi:hypothetical protein
MKAKAALHIKVFEIPKRSPDLSVLDYAVWIHVSRSMRRQEKSFRPSFVETRAEYLRRLQRTATGMSEPRVKRWIGDMRRRCQRLYDAEGGLFEEGGASREFVP